MSTVRYVKEVAKKYGVPQWWSYRAATLEDLRLAVAQEMQRHAAATRLARWYKSYYSRYVNHTDFTLEDLPPRTFRYFSNGKIYRFDPVSLARNMIKAGNFNNPYDNTEFNDGDLERLDNCLAQVAPNQFMKLCNKRHELRTQRQQEAEEERTFEFFEEDTRDTIRHFLSQDFEAIMDESRPLFPALSPREESETDEMYDRRVVLYEAAMRSIVVDRFSFLIGQNLIPRLNSNLISYASRNPAKCRALVYDVLGELAEYLERGDVSEEMKSFARCFQRAVNRCLDVHLNGMFEAYDYSVQRDNEVISRVLRASESGVNNNDGDDTNDTVNGSSDEDDVTMRAPSESTVYPPAMHHPIPRPVHLLVRNHNGRTIRIALPPQRFDNPHPQSQE